MEAIIALLPAAWRPYAKSVAAALGTLVSVLAVVMPAADAPRWVAVVISAATALGVYAVPNTVKPEPEHSA